MSRICRAPTSCFMVQIGNHIRAKRPYFTLLAANFLANPLLFGCVQPELPAQVIQYRTTAIRQVAQYRVEARRARNRVTPLGITNSTPAVRGHPPGRN